MNKMSYEVADIEEILKCSRPTVYKLFKKNLFVVLKVGTEYRVPIESFNIWFTTGQPDPACQVSKSAQ